MESRGVVGRVPAFQFGGPDSISGGTRNFNLYYGTGFVLSYVVSGGGPDILLATKSGVVHSLCFPYRHLTHCHLYLIPRFLSTTLFGLNYQTNKERIGRVSCKLSYRYVQVVAYTSGYPIIELIHGFYRNRKNV